MTQPSVWHAWLRWVACSQVRTLTTCCCSGLEPYTICSLQATKSSSSSSSYQLYATGTTANTEPSGVSCGSWLQLAWRPQQQLVLVLHHVIAQSCFAMQQPRLPDEGAAGRDLTTADAALKALYFILRTFHLQHGTSAPLCRPSRPPPLCWRAATASGRAQACRLM
jgi:hypothetical protein